MIIFWNKTGFWLAQKRLEMTTWPWPNTSQEAREFTSKTESLKKLYESQPFLFDAEEMGIKIENQCPEISDEDIAQALNDDDLFDRKSERKKPGRTRNKSKNLPRQKYVIDLSEEEKISEADFLERRVKEVKPHMDNLHSWLLEKKQ